MPAHTSATKAGFLQRLKDRRFQILLSKQLLLLATKIAAIVLGAVGGLFKDLAKHLPDAIADCDVGGSVCSDSSKSGYRHGPEGTRRRWLL
ncbi:hypothetical protein QCD60_00580 [Pokkaliibacter sp. MBI-7]|uniref:hypothetical protein n=1 Tax=Pokkaliibacter sp. MBI-7 TaxID=3040600 RepID=UPI00244A88DE|nr:hypothetical protein [Pokkaliibacter sp. MBI-7]MDH2431048.1 hypothetical protein [Pokkaliibacter sp. MBI-7]